MKDLKTIYLDTKKRLSLAGIENPAFDSAALIEKHTHFSHADILLNKPLGSDFCYDSFLSDLKRRENHEPLQYILSVWNFYGLDFYVGKGVLIPRQDTELLADTAIDFLKTRKATQILELCAGSGCLSTSVLKNVENSEAFCVELSKDALFYLKKNISLHKIEKKATILNADIFDETTPETIKKLHPDPFDLLICNPPYIKSSDIELLEPEVRDFEPLMALDGGGDGLKFYRAMNQYISLMKPGALCAFETGFDQGKAVFDILKANRLDRVFTLKDLSGSDRVTAGFTKCDNAL